METELQKEVLKIKGNGNGLTNEQMIDMKGQLDAINAAFAFIEFDTQGTILNANDIFLEVMGYKLNEIKGKHHSMFVDSGYAKSNDYKKFWSDLRNGESNSGEFVRINRMVIRFGCWPLIRPLLMTKAKLSK